MTNRKEWENEEIETGGLFNNMVSLTISYNVKPAGTDGREVLVKVHTDTKTTAAL